MKKETTIQTIMQAYLQRLEILCANTNANQEEFDFLINLLYSFCKHFNCKTNSQLYPTIFVLQSTQICNQTKNQVFFALIKKGANINFCSKNGTAFTIALKQENFTFAKRILKYKRLEKQNIEAENNKILRNINTLKNLHKHKQNITNWDRYFNRNNLISSFEEINQIIERKLTA